MMDLYYTGRPGHWDVVGTLPCEACGELAEVKVFVRSGSVDDAIEVIRRELPIQHQCKAKP